MFVRHLILPVVLACNYAIAAELSGRVVGVHDGDTITVLDAEKRQHKVRLAGIDAPELKQAFGARSKQSLSDLTYKQMVRVTWEKRDRYGRIVGKVRVVNTETYCAGGPCVRDAGLSQVRAGMAWWYRQYANEQNPEDRAAYEKAEAEANAVKLGLWADSKPIPPWEWRRMK